jgi:predicted nucleotidyltransferase
MTLLNDQRVRDQVECHPHRLVFASLSGSHLYGFPSQDSDVDIRGVHVLPADRMLGLSDPVDTHESMDVVEGLEVDVVTYDLKKYCGLLLNKNGTVLEQLVSPLVVATSDEHEELRGLVGDVVTRHHVHHYRGMTKNRVRAFEKSAGVKPLLYAFRAALTGIHLMKTGECEPDLTKLAEPYGCAFVDELIERKTTGEKVTLADDEVPSWSAEIEELLARLETAFEMSSLPDNPTAHDRFEELLVRTRLETVR